jgi:tetratricopeptide (TPR) repeat protein
MTRWIPHALAAMSAALWLSAAPPAFAEDDEDESAGGEVATGSKLPPLSGQPRSPDGYVPVDVTTREQYLDRPLPPAAYQGAAQLKMEPEFINAIQMGLEQIFKRDYNAARDTFEAVEAKFPGTAIADVVDMLIWQALMLENFDFKYDKQYWTSSKAAKTALQAAIAKPGNDAWEQLLMATVVGVESIHTMRRSEYLPALNLAFQAMDHIEKAKKAAPEFVDLTLADGLYNYWRSVITLSSKALPDFGDERVKGIEQMQLVEQRGVFLQPLATLSLAFTWIEENDYQRAAVSTAKNRRAYPDNIVNNLTAGTIYIYMRDYPAALKTLAEVERVDPKNMRVKYWKGLAQLRSKQVAEAQASFEAYLTYEHLEPYQRSWTHYRLGQVYARQKEYLKAFNSYEAAHKVDGHKGAQAAAERLKERKKEGKISF